MAQNFNTIIKFNGESKTVDYTEVVNALDSSNVITSLLTLLGMKDVSVKRVPKEVEEEDESQWGKRSNGKKGGPKGPRSGRSFKSVSDDEWASWQEEFIDEGHDPTEDDQINAFLDKKEIHLAGGVAKKKFQQLFATTTTAAKTKAKAGKK